MIFGKRGSYRDLLREILHLGEPPERCALAYGLGVFLSFSPFLGLHTILGLTAALLLRLNRLAVLVGVWTNTPLTYPPIASLGTALGLAILGTEGRVPELGDHTILSADFWEKMLQDVNHILLPFFVGNLILALIAGVVAYFVMRAVLVRHEKRKSLRRSLTAE